MRGEGRCVRGEVGGEMCEGRGERREPEFIGKRKNLYCDFALPNLM